MVHLSQNKPQKSLAKLPKFFIFSHLDKPLLMSAAFFFRGANHSQFSPPKHEDTRFFLCVMASLWPKFFFFKND
jgi:hypothetical protein